MHKTLFSCIFWWFIQFLQFSTDLQAFRKSKAILKEWNVCSNHPFVKHNKGVVFLCVDRTVYFLVLYLRLFKMLCKTYSLNLRNCNLICITVDKQLCRKYHVSKKVQKMLKTLKTQGNPAQSMRVLENRVEDLTFRILQAKMTLYFFEKYTTIQIHSQKNMIGKDDGTRLV